MDIVIGFQGKEHITASQVGRILAGMAGEGVYVLATQNQLAATMQTANQVRIDTGDLVMHGRVATVETPETLTVESGATGQKRNDLVVARYQKDASSSVESIQLVVVKGTPVSYGDSSDPQINGGSILDGDSPVDVPLWRIPIDGLAPGTPVKLFEVAPSADGLRDSVSQMVSVWSSAQQAIVGANKANDYSYNFSEILGEEFDEPPVVIPMVYNGSASLGRYGMSSINLVSVSKTGVTVRIYNGASDSVQWYIRLIVIRR